MTVPVQDSDDWRKEYNGNGVTVAFATPYFLENADIVAVLVDSDGAEMELMLTTDYTLAGAGSNPGGTLTMVTAPATGEQLVIYVDPDLSQETDLVENDALPVETAVERPLDKLTLMARRDRSLLFRTLRLPDGDTGFTEDDIILPAAATRAGMVLGFDEDGKPIAVTGTSDVTISEFIATVVDDTSGPQVCSTIGAASLVGANVFTKTQTWKDGGDIASTAALTLGDGNTFNITGVDPITSIGTKGVGTVVILRHAGAQTLTHHATDMVNLTGASITTASGDFSAWEEYATGDWRMIGYARANGQPLALPIATQAEQETGTSVTALVTPGRQQYHPGHPKCWGFVTVSAGTPTLQTNYNITSITDTATGRLTLTIDGDFSSANWPPLLSVQRSSTSTDDGNAAYGAVRSAGIAAGSVELECHYVEAGAMNLVDPTSWSFAGFGDRT